jgi:hypothetical protein
MSRRESKVNRRVGTVAALLVTTLGLCTVSVAGVQELVRDTQRMTEAGGQVTMVWWLPLQFWEESLKANPALPAEARQQILGGLADYNVIAMLRARTGATGFSDAQPKAELIKNAVVEANGCRSSNQRWLPWPGSLGRSWSSWSIRQRRQTARRLSMPRRQEP